VTRLEIALALREIGELLLAIGENPFRARAYLRGAESLELLDSDLSALLEESRLTDIPGIGSALAAQIGEIAATGRSTLLTSLRSRLPPGVLELRRLPGLTVRKIAALHDALGIASLDGLRLACEAGRLREVKGFGEKTERKILAAITAASGRSSKALLHRATNWAQYLLEHVRASPAVARAEIAGDLRRGMETIARLDLVAASAEPAVALEHFLRSPLAARTLERDAAHASVMLQEGLPATLWIAHPSEFGSVLVLRTGSPAHVAGLDGLVGSFKEEREVYASQGLPLIPPELRENEGEIEAARAGELPDDLLTLPDLTGFVHCHTTDSDGKARLEKMVREAEAMGAGFITITDHSASAYYARGLSIERLEAQWVEIARLQERVTVRILRGTEADILADGSLDYPDAILERMDVIIASIHSRLGMDRDQMTARLVRALRHPLFKIWGHPLGRLLERRPPLECRLEEVLDVAASTRTAIEINGDPRRLDLEPRWIRAARERGIPLVIATDAHSVGGLRNARYGVTMARRGWARRREVLNAQPTEVFRRAVRPTG